MLIRGYVRRAYKNKIEFASDAQVAAGDRWARVLSRSKIKSLTILDETVKFVDDVKRNQNRIGQTCIIEM